MSICKHLKQMKTSWVPFLLPPTHTQMLNTNNVCAKHITKLENPKEKKQQNMTPQCPYGSAGGGCAGSLSGWDQFGGHWDQLIIGKQQHHTQHSELREDQEAAQSPADQPAHRAGHHLWLLSHEPLQPLPSHCLAHTSHATGQCEVVLVGSWLCSTELKQKWLQYISKVKSIHQLKPGWPD